jgi:hypothetical protein
MSPEDLSHATCYPSAQQGREDAILCLETPQTLSPTYKLAYDDTDFLVRDDMRSVRLQLEMMKPEVELRRTTSTSPSSSLAVRAPPIRFKTRTARSPSITAKRENFLPWRQRQANRTSYVTMWW